MSSFLKPSSFDEHVKSVHRTLRHRGVFQRILFFVFVLVFFYFLCLAVSAIQVSVNTFSALHEIELAKQDVSALHLSDASNHFSNAADSLQNAKPFSSLLKIGFFLPSIGPVFGKTEALLSAGIDTATSLQSVVQIGEDLLRLSGVSEQEILSGQNGSPVSFADVSPETKQLMLKRLQASSNNLNVLASRLDVIRQDVSDLSKGISIPFVSAYLSSAQKNLEQIQSGLRGASLLTDVLPAFSGTDHASHFLVLFLNNTELRPGGGFAGVYGVATVEKGELRALPMADVYALDRLVDKTYKRVAPAPLALYNETPVWYFRDANWSPDFSESAKMFLQLFSEELATISPAKRLGIPLSDSFDGVIAITPSFAASILSILGPITVNGQTFTSENIGDKLEYQVEYAYAKQGIPEGQRKEIIGVLLSEAVKKIQALPVSTWPSIFEAMERSFQERQFFLYHTNPDVEKVIVNAGWSGNVSGSPPSMRGGRGVGCVGCDVQLVVDANLASLKTDPVVDRTIRYEIQKDANGNRIGRTTITYQHRGAFDWKTSRYRTYTRLYVPQGSELLSVSGCLKNDITKNPSKESCVPDVSTELGMTVFGAFISIEPGQTGTLTFEYKLSDAVRASIAKGEYTLFVFKQNGARNHALTLDLDFGKNVTHAEPAEDTKEWGDATYHVKTVLDQDKEFQIGL